MSKTTAPPRPPNRLGGAQRRAPAAHQHPPAAPASSEEPGAPLGEYQGPDGEAREIVLTPGRRGGVLVIDRAADTLGDPRLVAALAPDEPTENAGIVTALYLADTAGRRCGALGDTELAEPPAASQQEPKPQRLPQRLLDANKNRYRVQTLPAAHDNGSEVRWTKAPPAGREGPTVIVTLRSTVGALEAYEPALAISERALAASAPAVRATLAGELRRLRNSAMVLNRLLREHVQAEVARGTSLRELAHRCGRVQRNRAGVECGEAAWIARRVGLITEASLATPNHWIHSTVLALIAREALDVNPGEVEL
jgi:hypothetical protein